MHPHRRDKKTDKPRPREAGRRSALASLHTLPEGGGLSSTAGSRPDLDSES